MTLSVYYKIEQAINVNVSARLVNGDLSHSLSLSLVLTTTNGNNNSNMHYAHINNNCKLNITMKLYVKCCCIEYVNKILSLRLTLNFQFGFLYYCS